MNQVDVTIPVRAEIAKALENPVRREAAGRLLDGILTNTILRTMLETIIADTKREAHANGLTDADIHSELQAWRAERPA